MCQQGNMTGLQACSLNTEALIVIALFYQKKVTCLRGLRYSTSSVALDNIHRFFLWVHYSLEMRKCRKYLSLTRCYSGR